MRSEEEITQAIDVMIKEMQRLILNSNPVSQRTYLELRHKVDALMWASNDGLTAPTWLGVEIEA